jgi:cation diffusion facilitator family transporter
MSASPFVPTATPAERPRLLALGLALALATIAWNVVEGVVGIGAGFAAGSVALVGFGLDSFIETASAAVLAWRLQVERRGESGERTERAERVAGRIAGSLLLALAAWLVFDGARRLLGRGPAPRESTMGLVLTGVSLAVMPFLGWAKLRVARRLRSGALRADAYESFACAWLSLTTFGGLALNAACHWTWADPVAALVLVPLVVREGLEGLRGEDTCGHGAE